MQWGSGPRQRMVAVASRARVFALSRYLWARHRRFVVMFHGIARQAYPEFPAGLEPWSTQSELHRILSWVAKEFAFLTVHDFFASDRPGVLVTFDDGHANNLVNAVPVLEELSCPAIFFVSTQHVENPRDWLPAVRAAAESRWPGGAAVVPEPLASDLFDGLSHEQLTICGRHPLITIGAHTHTHPFLSRLSEPAIRAEVVDGRTTLARLSGVPIDYFAYPTGDYDIRALSIVREAGYRAAFAIEPRLHVDPRFEIPRVGLYFTDDHYLDSKLSGLPHRGMRADAARHWP